MIAYRGLLLFRLAGAAIKHHRDGKLNTRTSGFFAIIHPAWVPCGKAWLTGPFTANNFHYGWKAVTIPGMPVPGPLRRSVAAIALHVVAAFAVWPESYGQAQGNGADLALVLAIDCSYSVDRNEFDLQVRGTAQAMIDPEVLEAISNNRHGRIMVSVVQWSSEESQVFAVPWMPVSNAEEALALAARIREQKRQTAEGATSISGAIGAAIDAFARLPVRADRYVIDISGDGTNNRGERVDDARDRTVAAGITINGLTILNEIHWLHHYFRNHVIGGPGAFVEIANDYAAYREAIRKKILREIRGNWVS